MTPREQIIEQAMALSAEDRAFVADALEQSLPDSGFADSALAGVWAEEIERRIAAWEAGKLTTKSAADTIASLRQQLAVIRSRTVAQ
jgi:putative addiction module component (TIGR02574 family)